MTTVLHHTVPKGGEKGDACTLLACPAMKQGSCGPKTRKCVA